MARTRCPRTIATPILGVLLLAHGVISSCVAQRSPQSELRSSSSSSKGGFDPQCQQDPLDPFEVSSRLASAPHHCLETRLKRGVVAVDPSGHLVAVEALAAEAARVVHLANFHHNGVFWLVRLPLKNISRIIWHTEYWNPDLPAPFDTAHSQIRIELSKPLELLRPTSGAMKGHLQIEPQAPGVSEVRNLIFTADASGSPGESVDIVKAQFGGYVLLRGVKSLQQRAKEMFLDEHVTYRIAQFELPLTQEEQSAFVLDFFRRAQGDWLHIREGSKQSLYNTLKKNCATELNASVDTALGGLISGKLKGFWEKLLCFNPTVLERALLRNEKVVSLPDMQVDPELKDEIGFEIVPAVKRRK